MQLPNFRFIPKLLQEKNPGGNGMNTGLQAFILAAGAALLAAGTAWADGPNGSLHDTLWQTEDGKFVVRISECGAEELCGDLVWLRDPISTRTGEPRQDYRNPDPALRERPVCGLRIVQGLRPREENRWAGARLYNPDDGSSYGAAMQIDEATGLMALRAYVAIRALGRTMRLFPLEQPIETCA